MSKYGTQDNCFRNLCVILLEIKYVTFPRLPMNDILPRAQTCIESDEGATLGNTNNIIITI